MPGHPGEDLTGAAEIERHPLAGDRLHQAQQGGLAVRGGPQQGFIQRPSAEVGRASLHRAERGDHEHGLLEQGRAHRAIGHLLHAEGHGLEQQLPELTACGASGGAIQLGQITVALAQGLRRLQFIQANRETGLQQGDLNHHLFQGPGRGRSHQGGDQCDSKPCGQA